LLDKTCKF